jgi:glycosyltransferase involved in cell wall biosynthesis
VSGDRSASRVCVVGSGTRFLSGISYYTYFLSQSMSRDHQVSSILMRKLIPQVLYPGRHRVGTPITRLSTASFCPTYDGVDWYGVPSVVRAMRFLLRQRPDIVVFEWWSVSVFPWYVLLMITAKLLDARIVLELHEEIDPAEASIPFIGKRLPWFLKRLCRMSDSYVTHSEWDKSRLVDSLGLDGSRTWVIKHGPYPLAATAAEAEPEIDLVDPPTPGTQSARGVVRLLFFGTIRPYKGVEHLVEAFDRLPRDQTDWRLTIVGETWEGWTRPFELIEQSPFRADIELTNRYVTDAEVPGVFSGADVVVLPYLRSCASGPLQIAMNCDLPVVVTAVGGLVEAVADYDGAVLVPPADVDGLARGIVAAASAPRSASPAPHSWEDVATGFDQIFASMA